MTSCFRRSVQFGLILCICATLGPSVSAYATGAAAKKKTSTSASKRPSKQSRKRPAPRPVAFDPGRPQTLRAEAAVVVDNRTGAVVWAKNSDQRRPVASLTKLMTVLVVLDESPDLMDSTTVTMADVIGAGRSHVRGRNRVALIDLLHCALISSDNAATRALARSTGLPDAEFVRRMNERAQRMGMRNTIYHETTGLDPNNVSTATDQAILLRAATEEPLIRAISSTPTYSFRCSRRVETLTNTNRLLKSRDDIVSSKTGFIRPAGYCLAMTVGRDDPGLTAILLGAVSNAGRFAESAKLINWALTTMGADTPVPAYSTTGSQ